MITVCAGTQIRLLRRRTQYNKHSQLRMQYKNSHCHMWCCLFQRDPRGIGFDGHDKCGGELQMLMKYISALSCSRVSIWIIHFNWAKHTALHLSHATFIISIGTQASAGIKHTAERRRKTKKHTEALSCTDTWRHAGWFRTPNQPSSRCLTDRLFGSQGAVYLGCMKKIQRKKKRGKK